MVYHVKNGIFEKVDILDAESRATIGQATFSTIKAPGA